MNLLEDKSKQKNKKTKGEKVVLTLLIISIILCIAIFALLYFLQNTPLVYKYAIEINGNVTTEEQLGLIQLEDESKVISLKSICNVLGYEYFNGEYNTTLESKDKGYINNGINIIQFFADSNKIFKTKENDLRDLQYYTLNHNIIIYNDGLYINIEDLNVALNLIQYYKEDENKTIIQTPEDWIEKHKEQLEGMGYTIDDSPENMVGLAYGYVIVKNNEKYGVMGLNNAEIIGSKYNSIEFVEYTNQFIVSNSDNKYGIIDAGGENIIKIQFDGVKVLNFEPLLYQVKRADEYGIMKKDGTIINEISYSSIGYPENKQNNIIYTLIVPELSSNIPQSIVVCGKNGYGLIDLENGREIIPCTLKGIFLYVDVENDIKDYAVQLEDGTYNQLISYVDSLNNITVNINQ